MLGSCIPCFVGPYPLGSPHYSYLLSGPARTSPLRQKQLRTSPLQREKAVRAGAAGCWTWGSDVLKTRKRQLAGHPDSRQDEIVRRSWRVRPRDPH